MKEIADKFNNKNVSKSLVEIATHKKYIKVLEPSSD